MSQGKQFTATAQKLYTTLLLLRQLTLLEMQTNYIRCLWYNSKCQAVRLPILSGRLSVLKLRSVEEQKNSEVPSIPVCNAAISITSPSFLCYFLTLFFLSFILLLFTSLLYKPPVISSLLGFLKSLTRSSSMLLYAFSMLNIEFPESLPWSMLPS
jgi:hypothetical protein